MAPQKIALDTFEQIISRLSKYRFYKVAPFLQNEPLTDSRIFRFIQHMSETLHFKVLEISTNPEILTPALTDKLIETVKKIPHEIRLSFHGVDQNSLEANMGIHYERAISNTIYFLKNALKEKIQVIINTLGKPQHVFAKDQENYNKEDCLKFWSDICDHNDINFNQLKIRYRSYHNRCNNSPFISSNQHPIKRFDLTDFYCARVDRWFHILHNGDMILCCNDYHKETVFGNIIKYPIDQILRSSEYHDLLEKVTGKKPSPVNFLCKRCTSPGG
jgi:hypothetical protein